MGDDMIVNSDEARFRVTEIVWIANADWALARRDRAPTTCERSW
jgi:hypothetical protein